jgi:DNA-binding PadR family transcriptional regulator
VTSRLGYAIMALLARRPSTGYELAARTRQPLGYFWSAQHSQIHAELRRLMDAGLARFDAKPGPGPHQKKVYSLTAAGQGELSRWVPQPPASTGGGRDDILLKAYAAWAADPDAMRDLFASQIPRHQERLARYQEDRRHVESRHHAGPPPVTHPDFGSYATLKFGVEYERQRIDWLRWMVGQFTGRQAAEETRPPDGMVSDK